MDDSYNRSHGLESRVRSAPHLAVFVNLIEALTQRDVRLVLSAFDEPAFQRYALVNWRNNRATVPLEVFGTDSSALLLILLASISRLHLSGCRMLFLNLSIRTPGGSASQSVSNSMPDRWSDGYTARCCGHLSHKTRSLTHAWLTHCRGSGRDGNRGPSLHWGWTRGRRWPPGPRRRWGWSSSSSSHALFPDDAQKRGEPPMIIVIKWTDLPFDLDPTGS